MVDEVDRQIGAALTAVTMGIDRFERTREKGRSLGEGLVPIYMGRDLIPPRDYSDWEAIRADIADLDSRVAALADGPRKMFLTSMLRSLRTAVRLFSGEELDFATKVRELVGTTEGAVDPAVIEATRDRIDALLRARGIVRGDLAARIAAWEEEEALDPAEIPAVFATLMEEGQRRTDAMIFPTGDYTMRLKPVRGVSYTARCSFDAGEMDLNVDIRLTRPAMKHLVAHEVFPGHSTQLLYTRAGVDAGTSPPDALLCTADAVTGCVQEGIGDQGIELIDWMETADDALNRELRRLHSACQTSAAWNLMVEGWSEAKVAEFLTDVGCGQEAWVKGRIRMARHPFRGPFTASYWFGNEVVREVRERTPPERRDAFITALYAWPQSPESLASFH